MTASPISDLSPILMASRATVTFGTSPDNLKTIPVDEHFFTGYRKTVVSENETLVKIEIPHLCQNAYFLAFKQSKRKEDDIAIVNAAFYIGFEKNSATVKARDSYTAIFGTLHLLQFSG